METCRRWSHRIPEFFASADETSTKILIASEQYDQLEGHLPVELLDHLRQCPDCPNDVLWFLAVRDECDVASFPCVHLAYGTSSKANHVIGREHGVFTVATGPRTGIVIGYCPWCAIELPVGG